MNTRISFSSIDLLRKSISCRLRTAEKVVDYTLKPGQKVVLVTAQIVHFPALHRLRTRLSLRPKSVKMNHLT